MKIEFKEGMRLKQVKPLGYEAFDNIGQEFVVTKVENHIIFCYNPNRALIFGITVHAASEYFEIIDEKVVYINGNKVIRNGRVTVVILPDGSKGISKCLPEDTYDAQKGYEIALIKATIKSLNKKLKELCKER